MLYSNEDLDFENNERMKQLKEHGRPTTRRIEEKKSSDSCCNIVTTKNKNKELLKKKNGCQTFLFNFFLLNFLLPFCLLLPPTSGQYQVYREDPFAMLSATLQVILSFSYIFDCIYLFFCIVYILLELFYSSNGISILTNSLFIGILFRLTKRLRVMDRQSTLIAHQEPKLPFNSFNTADQLPRQK